MHEVRWERMFPDQLDAAFVACPAVYLTYGLCEPHGPHNALGLDGLKAHGLACEAARLGGGIVAPPDWWHIHEIGAYAAWGAKQVGDAKPWLTAVPPWHHFKSVLYQVRAIDTLGFHAALLITGHYGPNWNDLKRLVELVQPHVGCRLHGLPDFEALAEGFGPPDHETKDHAGRVETSQLWALEPGCVDLSRLPEVDTSEQAPGAGAGADPRYAAGSTAGESDRRTGERMIRDQARWLSSKAAELRKVYAADNHQPRLTTFDQVEQVWAEVVLPELPSFRSMASAETRGGVPTESRWFANAAVPDLPGVTRPAPADV